MALSGVESYLNGFVQDERPQYGNEIDEQPTLTGKDWERVGNFVRTLRNDARQVGCPWVGVYLTGSSLEDDFDYDDIDLVVDGRTDNSQLLGDDAHTPHQRMVDRTVSEIANTPIEELDELAEDDGKPSAMKKEPGYPDVDTRYKVVLVGGSPHVSNTTLDISYMQEPFHQNPDTEFWRVPSHHELERIANSDEF